MVILEEKKLNKEIEIRSFDSANLVLCMNYTAETNVSLSQIIQLAITFFFTVRCDKSGIPH